MSHAGFVSHRSPLSSSENYLTITLIVIDYFHTSDEGLTGCVKALLLFIFNYLSFL